jgi:hypothetical protein
MESIKKRKIGEKKVEINNKIKKSLLKKIKPKIFKTIKICMK